MALPAGSKLGPYEIIEPLGSGGMGEVYRARDTRLGRSVAIKVLPEHAATSADALERFQREARAVSSLNHPNICTLFDIGQDGDRDFIVMEYLEGETLTRRIRSSGELSAREAAEIAVPVARGLAEAHAHGIVHRDIKPGNIFLTKQGVVKIIDFGLARLVSGTSGTRTLGVTTGTIGYMSPEQTLGKPVDARTDVWALGVILAEMLAGVNPFQRDSASAILFAIVNDPPAPPSNAPPELQKIIYRALSKDPAGRYADCAAMAEDLETFRSSIVSAAGKQPVDFSAPTATLRHDEVQKYIERASASAWQAAPAPRKRASPWWFALAIPLLAALAFAFPGVRSRIGGGLFGSTEKHIAVLPFENIGNNAANAPLAEGLMDSLTGMLSNLDVGNQSLWVVPSSIVRARKVTDPSAALRELGATLVVEGSIEREGQDIHLTVNLINAKTMRQIGSAQLEDPAGDLATLQDEAVARLARLMDISVTAEMLKNTGGKANPVAYQSYLTALGYIQRWDKPGNLDRAIAALNDALKTDPSFALGYAELGEAYRLKNQTDPNPQWIDEAAANCNKALQLDNHLPAVYVTLGQMHASLGKDDLALQEFQNALQIDPRNPGALSGLARSYERMGRINDAEAAFKRAAALRPDYWDGYNSLGLFYVRHQRFPDAISEFRRVIALTPDNATAYNNLATAYIGMGDPKALSEAVQALEKSVQISPSYAGYANLGALYISLKDYAKSAAMTEKALQFNDKDFRVWANLALAYQWLQNAAKFRDASGRERILLEEYVKAHPTEAMGQSALATIYAEDQQKDRATTHLDAALALAPKDPQILADAAEVWADLGDRARAIQYAQMSLKNGSSLDDLRARFALQAVLSDPKFRPNPK